jgi:magnesium transporter
MKRLTTRRGRKAGLPPGSIVHIGGAAAAATRIEYRRYDAGACEEDAHATLERCLAGREAPGTKWINVEGVHDVELLKRVGEAFGIHPLAVEDIANTEQRPKIEEYGDYLFVVLKMLRRNGDQINAEQVSLVVGRDLVISFQESDKPGDVFDPLRARLRAAGARVRGEGADFLAYSMMDAVVDNYFVVLETLGEQIDRIEEEQARSALARSVESVHGLRRELLFLRRSVWPLREVLARLARRESPLIGEKAAIYFRDVYDHTVQVMDNVEALRELLSSLLDVHLTRASLRMNETMKALTLVATIFIPLTFIVGVYGMNFDYLPELRWRYAYPVLWVLMIALAVGMVIWFKRKKWL